MPLRLLLHHPYLPNLSFRRNLLLHLPLLLPLLFLLVILEGDLLLHSLIRAPKQKAGRHLGPPSTLYSLLSTLYPYRR
jgi:hypothetical protein